MKTVDRIREWLEQKGYDGIVISRRDNYAWITQGAQNHVLSSTEDGVAFCLISQDGIKLLADSSDLPRMSEEQNPLHAECILVPWYESMEERIAELIQDRSYASDTGIAGTVQEQDSLIDLRMQLSEEELVRYREIGALCAEIVEGVCRDASPGQTEAEIACELKCRCLQAGVSPDCVLVGADERILKYRHPMPTEKKVDKSLMVVLGGEKYGLNISITRMVSFGDVPEEIQNRYKKTQYIFSCMQTMMRDGITYGEYFSKVQKLYREAGYENEWKMHHQGGPTGYGCREFVITPKNTKKMKSGQAYAWNPTIQGTKCEETTYLGKEGVETFTRTKEWPRTVVQTPYGVFEVVDILRKFL